MSRERRVLLLLLALSLFLSVAGLLLTVGLERLRMVQDQIGVLKIQYARLQKHSPGDQGDLRERMRELQQAADAELRRYYEKDETDLYRFGSAVNGMLARHGMTVGEFRTLAGEHGSVLEITASGAPSSLVAFLSEVSSGRKYWTLPYLHVQSSRGSGSLTCELQIGYLVHETSKQAP